MAQFEELQQLWRRQPPPAMAPHHAAELSGALRRYGRRHDLIYLGKAFVIACQLALLVWLLRHRPLALFGACLADFSAILFLISDWRSGRAIGRLNFAAPSVDFLRDSLARLHAQRHPFGTREFYIAICGFSVGCGLLLASVWPRMTLSQDVLLLAVLAAEAFGGYALAVRIRRNRFEKRCRPLIERLESVLQIMEADRL
jgi:hypothetical protein